jgi:hypothetical protein
MLPAKRNNTAMELVLIKKVIMRNVNLIRCLMKSVNKPEGFSDLKRCNLNLRVLLPKFRH